MPPEDRDVPSGEWSDPETLLLIRRVRAGDEEAWGALFARVRGRLLRFIARRMHPRIRARMEPEDVLQMVHLEAFQELGRVNFAPEAGAYYRWLCWKVRRVLARLGRAPARGEEETPGAGEDPAALAAPGATPSKVLQGRELMERVVAALEEMGSPYREVFTLRVFHGKSAEEVARLLGKSVQTVYNVLAEARQRLRERGLGG